MTRNYASIPIVDLKNSLSDVVSRRILAQNIDDICRGIGFFIIVGHEIDPKIQDDMLNVSREFFQLPLSIKTEIRGSEDYPYGYNGIEDENLSRGYENSSKIVLADRKESFSIGPEHECPIRWPSAPKCMKEIWLKYFHECHRLSKTIYRLFALALNLDENWFEDKIDQHRSALRALFYPELTEALRENQYRSSPHTDYGAFTILKQDSIGGLQVQSRNNQQWIDVPFVENSFVINLGDLMSRWTNDRWVSTPHRVIVSSYDQRQSLAFFCQINPDHIVECIPTCLSLGQTPNYSPIKSWDLVMQKYLASTGKIK